ncbi:MAG TPA: hypothetical protein DDY78_29270 [Planctomycetales bacterium]|jgi:hypothetical protein|nr:hypothetical protein [Planctomycetales bacterium]
MRHIGLSFRGTFFVVALLAAPLQAASPRDELLRFVPDDVGFCFVMQDLRVHAAELSASPFIEQLRMSPAGAAFRATDEIKQLDKVDKYLHQALGVGWDQLRDDVFGDAVVFAYRPGPPGKPDQEQGLVLLRGRDGEVLSRLVEKINQTQKKDGALTDLQEVKYENTTYYRRVEPKQTNYYYLRGPVFLFTSQEDMLRRAIDLERATADAEPAFAKRLREVGADRAVLALWLNPRAFDASLEEKAAKAAAADAALQQKVLAYWKAVDGVAVWATLDADLRLSFAQRVRPEKLPTAVSRFLGAASRPSELWRRFPDDALLACGGRIDAGALFELFQDAQPKDDKDPSAASVAFGKDLVTEVLSHVGPDWGFCLTAPKDGKDWLPQAFLAIRAEPGDETAPVDQALLSAVHTAALAGVLSYNHQHAAEPLRLKSFVSNKQAIHYVDDGRVLPPGVQPAYGLTNGWMAFASSPDVFRRFTESAPKRAADDGAAFPLLRASLKGWRGYLTERREPLATALAEKNLLPVEEVRKRLDDLIGVLQFVDRLEIDCRTGPGLAVVTLTIQTARPLKKAGGS